MLVDRHSRFAAEVTGLATMEAEAACEVGRTWCREFAAEASRGASERGLMPAETARQNLLARAISLSRGEETPFLVLDCDIAVDNWSRIKHSIHAPNVDVFYSLKANPDAHLARALTRAGSGFDIASGAELELLGLIGVKPEQIIFSAPVKLPRDIGRAFEFGVRRYVYDSETEIEKLAALAPGSEVLLRLSVSNEGSRWPLARKFGAPPEEALDLLLMARRRGLKCVGLTFHVGSQCESPGTWDGAIGTCRAVWRAAETAGLKLSVLDIGGGLPARYTGPVPSIEALGARITGLVSAFPPDTTVLVEPGRAIVADAGVLAATVIGKRTRSGRTWLYLDVGVYNGLMEAIEGWRYEMFTTRGGGPVREFVLAGPTCDSTDVIADDALLPELEVGDHVFFAGAGAYTTAYERYNGLSFPATFAIGPGATVQRNLG